MKSASTGLVYKFCASVFYVVGGSKMYVEIIGISLSFILGVIIKSRLYIDKKD